VEEKPKEEEKKEEEKKDEAFFEQIELQTVAPRDQAI